MIRNVRRVLHRLRTDARGATAIEYSLLLVIASVIVFALAQVGNSVYGSHGGVATKVVDALN